MAKPENTVIDEQGNRFHGQPAWTEDMYNTYSTRGKAGSSVVDYMRITERLRKRHNFPPEAHGLVLRTRFDGDGNDPVTGEVMGENEFEAFRNAIEGIPAETGKNNWALIEDIAGAIARSGAVNSESEGIGFIFDIVRDAVYRNFPENGPDDVWREALVNQLFEHGMIAPGCERKQVERVFTETFRDSVYGYHPAGAEG